MDFCGCPSGAQLLTPGTATCEVVGGATIVSLSDNTVIQWNSFVLPSGHEMQFNFLNPQNTVVNRVTGTGTTLIGGTISSNGNVVILAPNSWMLFRPTAQVTAGSFTASGPRRGAVAVLQRQPRDRVPRHAADRTRPR